MSAAPDADKQLKQLATLRAKHTAQRPALPFAKAMTALGSEAPGSPAFQGAALACLTWRFTPLGDGVVDPKNSYGAELARVVDAAEAFAPAHRERFAADVLLNLTSAADYRALWPLVVAWVPADTLAAKVIEALSGDNWLHVRNALSLSYQALGRREGYVFSESDAAQMQDLAAAIAEMSTAPHVVRAAAKSFRLPRPL